MISRETTIMHLKQLFKDSLVDTISIEDALKAGNRESVSKKQKRGWIKNRLYYFKYYNLADAIYAKVNNSDTTSGIQLTEEGKRIVRGVAATTLQNNHISIGKESTVKTQNKISLEDILKAMPRLKEEYPAFEINFDFKLKSG